MALDIAQETALAAFLNLARLREQARFGAWLHAIAANIARMYLRQHRVHVSVIWSEHELPPAMLYMDSLGSPRQ